VVEASALPSGDAQPLTAAQLQPIVVEAERRLASATGIQVAAAMSGLSVQIADLPGNVLGEARDQTIYLSPTAAGYGWFVDPTPGDDLEFADLSAARKGSPAAQRVDLLTTVMHEMGHLLGYAHSDSSDLMYPTLPLGQRRLFPQSSAFATLALAGRSGYNGPVESDAVDQLFASSHGNDRNWSWI